MLVVGDTIGGKYLILRVLGAGGMGQVFEARNQNTGRRVAIKTLHQSMLDEPTVVQRFLREARSASSVTHPNVVDVLDLDTDDAKGVPYIVQEFLVGQSLEDYLDGQPGHRLAPPDALRIMAPIMSALIEAHRKSIVHRDLKHANLFITRDAAGVIVPKVIDFGIARADHTNQDGVRTGTGTPIGTPRYMSPEQAAGSKSIDARTDVWSLGVVLYEMLTGRTPYDAPNFNLLIGKILYEAPTPITAVDPSLPTDIVSVLDVALAREVNERWDSMTAFRTALSTCADWPRESAVPAVTSSQPHANHETPSPRGGAAGAAPTLPDPALERPSPSVSVPVHRSSLYVGASALLASVLVLAIWAAFVRQPARAQTPPPVAAPTVVEAPAITPVVVTARPEEPPTPPPVAADPVAPPVTTAPAPRLARPRGAARPTGARPRTPERATGFDTDYP